MRKYKTKTEQVKREVCVEISCDLCGRKGVKDGWECGYYEQNETTVKVEVSQQEGRTYPDGDGWGTKYIVDMCPECFKAN